MKYTDKYKLKKPELFENVLVEDLNENMDIVDAELSKIGDSQTEVKQQFTQHLAENASITKKGHVQLSDSTTSTSTTMAATANAVKKVNDTATTKYTKPTAGIPKTDMASDVQASLGKADTALQSVAVGTTTQPGIVQLEDSTTSSATNKAATANAVKSVYDLARNGAKINSGSYTGNSQSSVRNITVGFKPKLLFIETTNQNQYITLTGVTPVNSIADIFSGRYEVSNTTPDLDYTSVGFSLQNGSQFNKSGYTYGWVAIG